MDPSTGVNKPSVMRPREERRRKIPFRGDFWLSFLPEDWWFGHRVGITIFSDAGVPDRRRAASCKPGTLIALLRRVLVVDGLDMGLRLGGLDVRPLSVAKTTQYPGRDLSSTKAAGWSISPPHTPHASIFRKISPLNTWRTVRCSCPP